MANRNYLDRERAEVGYSDFDRERFLTEDRSGGTRRGEFARDRARLLHSSALRRLGAKTQVLSPSGGDFARTRLTHSLEVAQIGREMAIDLGLNADIVDLASLAHDLGHPPFGHNGEKALNEWASDIGGFEGNAQTLRLITRIEPKVFSETGQSLGLNLTRASLDATCKYPWTSEDAKDSKDHSVKFGVYEDDLEIFNWMRIGAPSRVKCVEAQVMDFADDVAYSVHDFEDAVVSGFVNLRALADKQTEEDLLKKISEWTFGEYTNGELSAALDRLSQSRYWLTKFDNSPADLGTLKNLTSELIGRFVSKTTDAIIDASSAESVVRYGSRIEVPVEVRQEIAALKGLVSAFLMSHESRRPFYEWQRAVLSELSDALLSANGKNLDSYSANAWLSAKNEQERKRVIVDQVASLTDQSALNLHNRLASSGI
ncbi:MAG: deoxyguanosinetriphosphate triphosphohydrolase [Rhodoluna sp.]